MIGGKENDEMFARFSAPHPRQLYLVRENVKGLEALFWSDDLDAVFEYIDSHDDASWVSIMPLPLPTEPAAPPEVE